MTFDLQQAQVAYTTALRNGDDVAAEAVVKAARAAQIDPTTIYLKIFTPSMVTIGELWEQNELSVAEEHLATEITERLIGQMTTWFNEQVTTVPGGRVVMGCVAGERHTLGLRMLTDLFRQQGWRVLYLGADVPRQDWVNLVMRFKADLVAISASADRLVPEVKALIEELRAAQPNLEILVGGACWERDPKLWSQVGATQFHCDVQAALALAASRYARNRNTSLDQTC